MPEQLLVAQACPAVPAHLLTCPTRRRAPSPSDNDAGAAGGSDGDNEDEEDEQVDKIEEASEEEGSDYEPSE